MTDSSLDPPWRRRGGAPRPVAERFWEKVDRTADCWIWLGARTNRGYGVLRIAGRNVYAHRLVLTLAGRPLAEGEFACHSCDNPPCVNPAHVSAGSNAENILDASAKGRLPQHSPEWIAKTTATLRRYHAEHPRQRLTVCRRGHPLAGDNVMVRWNPRRGREERRCRACVNATVRRAYWRQRVTA